MCSLMVPSSSVGHLWAKGCAKWFSCEVAGDVVACWLQDSKNPVMQSELLAVAVALELHMGRHSCACCLRHVD